MDPELKKKIESVLFAVGKKMEIGEIGKLVGTRDIEAIKGALLELQFDYEQSDRSLALQNDGEFWKLAVRDRYAQVISKLVTQTELTKSVMETLAVIAYKAPMMQSDVIKIRTNKAYDHLVELEKMGYITRKKKGRTKEIRLAEKFFEYFDVPPERLRDKFRTVTEMESIVAEKEKETTSRKENLALKLANSKQSEEETKASTLKEIQKIEEHIEQLPVIELVNDAGKNIGLEITNEAEEYNVTPTGSSRTKIAKDKFEGMEIVDASTKPEEGEPEILDGMQVYERKKRAKKKQEKTTQATPSEEGIIPEKIEEAPALFGENVPKEITEMIAKRAEELLHGPAVEKTEENKPTEENPPQ